MIAKRKVKMTDLDRVKEIIDLLKIEYIDYLEEQEKEDREPFHFLYADTETGFALEAFIEVAENGEGKIWDNLKEDKK